LYISIILRTPKLMVCGVWRANLQD
jgi:hypothetical protein